MLQRLLTMDEKPERASTCRTSSGSIVSSNEDLMVNILSRLAVKVISRFKCVSKEWNVLISDVYFVSSHHGRATQDPNIMKVVWVDHLDGCINVCSIQDKEQERIVTRDLIRPNYPNVFHLQADHVHMIGYPCNGLICLAVGEETLVCNPATLNTVVIPRDHKREYNHLQGLGFCSSSNEFKVVRLFERSEQFGWYGCELFTVGQRRDKEMHLLQHSHSWRHVGNLPYKVGFPSADDMCYVNGNVHWIIKGKQRSSSEFILSLDLELEEFKVVSCPENLVEEATYDDWVHLKELGGKLCVVTNGCPKCKWDIWVLKDYTNSIWSKEYHINLEGYWVPTIPTFSVLAICRGWLLLSISAGTISYYDPINNFLEEVVNMDFYFWPPRVARYVESLVIPF